MPVVDAMPDRVAEDDLPLQLWGAEGFEVVPWAEETWRAGFNSHTWLLERGGERRVLKAVPSGQQQFAGGLLAAEWVERAGIPAGAPVRTREGGLTAEQGPRTWALLKYLDGRLVDETDADDMARAGRTLGLIHRALQDMPVPSGLLSFADVDWLFAPQEFLTGANEWIPEALRAAFAPGSDGLTTGLVHGDPHIKDFRCLPGGLGLLDWGEVLQAPHVYDVAVLLSLLADDTDPTSLLRGYLETAPGAAGEFGRLPQMLMARAAIEAWIYAGKGHFSVDTGGQTAAEYTNDALLERARNKFKTAEALPSDHFLL